MNRTQEQAIADLQGRQQPSAAAPPPAPSTPPAQAAAPAPASVGAPTVTDQLVRWGELAGEGLLTPEAFAAAKAEPLGV
ncbi:hypothetical protein [Streptomyces sp. Qhu_M48]|uniref:hypothetical protein n=1 Tax=Streptomyces sp. Qhu_M48 TaxID=3435889 RepID=UPI003F4FCDD2